MVPPTFNETIDSADIFEILKLENLLKKIEILYVQSSSFSQIFCIYEKPELPINAKYFHQKLQQNATSITQVSKAEYSNSLELNHFVQVGEWRAKIWIVIQPKYGVW